MLYNEAAAELHALLGMQEVNAAAKASRKGPDGKYLPKRPVDTTPELNETHEQRIITKRKLSKSDPKLKTWIKLRHRNKAYYNFNKCQEQSTLQIELAKDMIWYQRVDR